MSAQSASVMAVPPGVNQPSSAASAPARNRRRRKTGWAFRNATSRRVKSSSSVSTWAQSNQVIAIVLAVGVVVALLGAAEFVAAQQQRHPEGEQQGGQHGAALAGPQGDDVGVVGRPLGAAVPRPVVVGAVAVVLAVGLVVLGVVGDQVGQGEPVVHGDQVDRRGGPPAGAGEEVRGAGEPGGEVAEQRRVAPARSPAWCRGTCRSTPATGAGTAQLVAVRLARRPTARRSAWRGRPPGPGRPGRRRRDTWLEAAVLAAQRGGQVEAEAVDVHLGHPVAQGVHDQPQRSGSPALRVLPQPVVST